jgi:hypothetical protein
MSPSEPSSKIVIELRRPYAQLTLAVVFFAACAAALAHEASTNDRGVVINGLVHLERGGADVFYAVLAALSVGFVVLGLVALWGTSRLRQFRIVIGSKAVRVPPSPLWRPPHREIEIPLADVRAIETNPPNAPTWVTIVTAARRYPIQARVLPPDWPPRAVADAIAARLRAKARPEG